MSMMMSGVERRKFDDLRKEGYSKREAEDYIRELREKYADNVEDYPLRRTLYGPGAKQTEKREKARDSAREKGTDPEPEHPVRSRYVKETDLITGAGAQDYLSKAQYQALQEDMAQEYNVPVTLLQESNLVDRELLIPKVREVFAKPDQQVREALRTKKGKWKAVGILNARLPEGVYIGYDRLFPWLKELQG